MIPQGTLITFPTRETRKAFGALMPERCFATQRDGVTILFTCATDVIVSGGRDDRLVELKPPTAELPRKTVPFPSPSA